MQWYKWMLYRTKRYMQLQLVASRLEKVRRCGECKYGMQMGRKCVCAWPKVELLWTGR